jgi:hypothetical protein
LGGLSVALAIDACLPAGTRRGRALVVGVVARSLGREAVELLFDSSVSTADIEGRAAPAPFEQFRSFDDWFEDSLLDTIVALPAARTLGRTLGGDPGSEAAEPKAYAEAEVTSNPARDGDVDEGDPTATTGSDRPGATAVAGPRVSFTFLTAHHLTEPGFASVP